MKLRDCRGIVESVNAWCTCGGGGPGQCCHACDLYHAIGDMEMFTEDEKRAACEAAWNDGRDDGRLIEAMSRGPAMPGQKEPSNPYAKRKAG